MRNSKIIIRKAFPQDAPAIKALINHFAEKRWMLPRSLSEIYDVIRNFWVVEKEGKIVGSAALSICWEDIAEIRSLAVAEEVQKQGWGERLVEKCLSDAAALKIKRVFTLTFVPEFFSGRGFKELDKKKLPLKIWRDCLNCPYFPDCREVAMIIELSLK